MVFFIERKILKNKPFFDKIKIFFHSVEDFDF